MTLERTNKILFFIFLLICNYQTLFCDDKEIALYYFRQAEILYDSGEIKEARKLLINSYEFYPHFSETTYLLSLVCFKDQHKALEGLSYLKQAINDNSWVTTDPHDALRELGRAYLQTKMYKQATDIFLKMGNKLKEDMYAALLLAKTYKEAGSAGLEMFLSDSLKRFPSYVDFYLLYAEYLENKGNKKGALGIINQGLEKIPEIPALILAKSRLTDEPAEVENLISLYFDKGGQSPLASITALSLGLAESEYYLDLFFKNDGNKDILFLDQLIHTVMDNAELLKNIEEMELNYSGKKVVDENRDGFYEELYDYNNGNLITWQKDNNQDGITEAKIEFQGQTPEKITLVHTGDNQVFGEYSTYPYLESITYETNKKAREYLLLPLQFQFSLFRQVEDEKIKTRRLPVLRTLIPPSENTVSRRSFRVNEYIDGMKTVVTEFLNGEYVSLSRDTDKDGHIDHIIDYDNGVPIKGRRDLDNNGTFEIKESYKNGNLTQITYDQNNDDRPDCIQFYDSSGKVTMTHWDYNSDGIIDAKEIMGKGSAVTFYFSTGFNGKFDLNIVFDSGRVLKAKRGVKNLQIIPGAGKGIYWIGKRGRSMDVRLYSRSGLYYNSGKVYFVVKYKDSFYIEELE